MGNVMTTTARRTVFALIPDSPFGGSHGTRLYVTKEDAKAAQKFEGGTGRVEEIPVHQVQVSKYGDR